MKFSRKHTLQDLGVLDWEEILTPHRHIFCSKHPEEEIKIVCKTCKNVPICQFCKVLKHDSHKSRILAEEAMELTSSLEKNLKLCKAQLEYLELCARNVKARDLEVYKSEQEDICKIIHQEDELVCLLNYLRERIKTNAQQLIHDIKQYYAKVRKETKRHKERISMEKIKCLTLEDKTADNLSEELKRLEENRRYYSFHPKQDQLKVIKHAEKWMQSTKLKVNGLLTDLVKEKPESKTVFLKYNGYPTRSLVVDSFQKVEIIKRKIAKKFCIEGIGEVILRFVGKELMNERRLCEYDIHDGSTLECTMRLLPSKPILQTT
ncbi:hypothetical protein CHS0354_025819 [Potamilus streckersoni]|uniref:Ubiquitin-like domain-containing protein n=1 Tax=Potamilus streckersoni TaxID=2493646 RepID=A0AAE0T5A7_9BIVA|nr:hypothetical protein CHS0354_025819 [Potamilus streckersoni]